ncbi:hypothetical protein [Novosphingobium sp. 9U]|uniref:hypothetical protein n=1 Tax=Novosphingobium sp. 9U TaxID=2653158 RepID=UPI0012F152DC|nr:hypothetical protein [Novosphingobium sp. 9U]VWX50837.1 conserved hypothetical protein [Novosphingobium sp. 9U]
MAFRDNSVVITSAHVINVEANGEDGDVYSGTDAADAFVIADGAVGDDLLQFFDSNDSIITHKAIFDGNNDGYIAFGPGAQLDVDRFGSGDSRKGDDNLSVLGTGNERVTEIRYLGFKPDEVGTKNYVYADSNTRDALLGRFDKGFQDDVTTGADSSITQNLKIDNDVSSNTFNFGTNSVALLTDNALGVNFGSDTIDGFGDDDLLVFTSLIHNRNDTGTGDSANTVTFGKNLVLDLSGAEGPLNSDPTTGPGGQFDLNAPNQVSIHYLGEKLIGDTTYYYYGTANAATPDGVTYA